MTCVFYSYYAPEPFLSRRVPQLQFHFLSVVHVHEAGEEIHAHGGIRDLGEGPVREMAEQRTFPHRRVPDQDDPELEFEDGFHHVIFLARIPRK